MAKSRDDFSFDDFDVDNFNYDENFGEGIEMQDNRSPVTKVSTEFLSGVKESTISPSALRTTLRKALPKGYGQAWSTLDTVVGEGASLYHEINKELKPAIRDFKRAAKGAKPMIEAVLPKSVSAKLDKLLEDKDAPQQQLSADDAQQGAIDAGLNAIFQHQKAAEEVHSAETATKEASDRARHQESSTLMDSIARSTGRLASYQDTIGVAFQRKSLELQYRQYFIAKDHLARFGAYTEEVATQLRAIAKNTGLPEAVKVHNSELMGQVFKERLYGAIHENLSQNAGAYLKKWMRTGGDRIKQSARDFSDALGSAAMGLESATMMNELSRDMPGGAGAMGMAGNMAGSSFGNWLGGKAGGYINTELEKNETARKGSNQILYTLDNLPGLANRWATGVDDEPSWMRWIPGFVKNFLRDTAPGLSDGAVLQDRSQDATQPAQWDQHSRKTLLEIIPGYLARILQSSERHRLGTDEVPLMLYDYDRSAFATGKSIARRISKMLGGGGDLERLDDASSKIVQAIDPDGNRLTASQKMGLQLELLSRAQDPRKSAFVAKDFTEGYFEHLQGNDAQVVRELFSEYLGEEGDRTKSRLYDLSTKYREIASASPKMLEQINLLAQTGNRDVLRNMGVLAQSGGRDVVSNDYLLDKFINFVGTGSDYDSFVDQEFADGERVRAVGSSGRRNVPDDSSGISRDFTTNSGTQMGSGSGSANQKVSFEGINEHVDRLVAEIRGSSSKSETADAAATLREILALLGSGALGSGSAGTGPGSSGGSGGSNWFSKSTGWLGTKSKGAIKGLWNLGGTANNALTGGIKRLFKGVKQGWDWVKDRKARVDIYVRGKLEPVLFADKMENGDYVDATDPTRVIKSWKDIRGAVIDRVTGEVVLKTDDIRQGLTDFKGKLLLDEKASWLKGKLGWVGKQLWNAGKAPFTAFSWARKTLRSTLLRPVDIYVPGESKPRLYASILLEGRYHSLEPKKRIWGINDIEGDVYDEFNDMVLPYDVFAKGVVDIHGKPLKTRGAKIKGLVTGAFSLGSKAVGWAKDQVLGGFKFLSSIGERLGNWMSQGSGGIGGSSNRQTEVLIRIHNLLCRHFGYEDTIAEGDLNSNAGSFFSKAKQSVKSWWAKRPSKEAMKAKAEEKFEEATVAAERMKDRASDKVDDWKDELKAKKDILMADPDVVELKAKAEVRLEEIKNRWRDRSKLKDSFMEDPRVTELKAKAELRLEEVKRKLRERFKLKDDEPMFKQLTDRIGKLFGRAMGRSDEEMDGKETIRERLGRKAKEWREGSWQDQLQERSERARNALRDRFKPKEKETKDEGSGIFSKILMGILGLGTTMSGVLATAKSMLSGIFGVRTAILATQAATAGVELADTLGGIGGGPDTPEGKNTKGKPGTAPAKKPGLFRRAAGWAGRGATAVGSGAAATAGGLWKAGGWFSRGALAAGGAAAGAAGFTLGGIAAGVGALASGAFAVLTSPITLGAAAVGGVGYAGYKGYQYLKGEAAPLERLRMAHYGIDPDINWQCKKIFDFEEGLLPFVKMSGKTASLSDGIDWEQWFTHFDVNPESKANMESWTKWFVGRFKPVFLQWYSVVKSISPTASFQRMDDDVDSGYKMELARRTRFTRQDAIYPYDVSASWGGEWSIAPGTALADRELDDIIALFKGTAVKQKEATVRTDAAGRSTVTTNAFGNTTGIAKPTVGQSPTSVTSAKFIASSDRAGSPIDPKKSSLGDFTGGAGRVIDDFTVVRLKTYGLVDLTVSRVNALLALEKEALLDVVINADGTTQFKVSAEAYYREFATNFEMSTSDVEQQEIWRMWFLNRFIPVLLNYVAAIRRLDKNVAIDLAWRTLKSSQIVSVADAVRNTRTSINDNMVSVWSINASPFPGMAVNLDPSSVQRYYDSVKSRAKDDKYSEPVLKQAPVSFQTVGKDGKPTFNKLPNFGGPQPFQSSAMRKAQDPAVYKDLVSSNPTLKAGSGIGGYYNDIPEPKGDGNWEAVKDTIIKAAEIVGVDPGLMATMARIESGFRTQVKAKTSSARGLYQFLASTWQEMMGKYANQYGIPANAQPTDARAASIIGGLYLKNNMQYLENKLGRGINANDIYAAHFLGPYGAQKLLSAPPDTPADSILPKAAQSNVSVFYDNRRPKTVSEIYDWIDKKISGNVVLPRAEETDGSILASNAPGEIPDGSLGGENTKAEGSATTVAKAKTELPAAPKLASSYQQSMVRAQAGAAPAVKVGPTSTPALAMAPIQQKATGPSKEEQKVVAVESSLATKSKQQEALQARLAKTNLDVQKGQHELLGESVEVQKGMGEKLDGIKSSIDRLVVALSKSNPQLAKQEDSRPAPQASRTLVDAPRPPISMARTT
jgi:hypothetical protein